MSQAELAIGIGVTQSALSHYENGSCDPLVDTARRLIAFARDRGIIWRLDDVYARPMPIHSAPAEPVKEGV